MWCASAVFHYLLNSQKRLHKRKTVSVLLFFLFIPFFSLCWSLRMPLTWWSYSAPSSQAQHSHSDIVILKASSPTRRLSPPRTPTKTARLMEMAVPRLLYVWQFLLQRQKPCRPLWPSAALRKPCPSPARTWPATCVRSSGTRITLRISALWPHHGVLQERSAASRVCALSAP